MEVLNSSKAYRHEFRTDELRSCDKITHLVQIVNSAKQDYWSALKSLKRRIGMYILDEEGDYGEHCNHVQEPMPELAVTM
jgi:hypothetical protein